MICVLMISMTEKKQEKKEIVVGLSGGVDSSMSLVLLKKQGWRPVGVSLKYAVWQDKRNPLRENICCTRESLVVARKVCQKMGVPYHIVDVSREFKKEVIDYFVGQLKKGKTPNPCLICNRYLKFKKLLEWADRHKIRYVATGHYAQIYLNKKTEQYELRKAKDTNKDQTYSLSLLPQKWLKRLVFPLGNYLKKEIFALASQEGFDFYLKRKESQDFCFVSGQCLNCFLAEEIGLKPGPVKDGGGRLLSEHRGLHFYTIGQKKGIDLAQGPYFVAAKLLKTNTLVVSKNQKDLLKKEVILSPCHFLSGQSIKQSTPIKTKIRSRQKESRSLLMPLGSGKMKIIFSRRQKAITPGQFAVFYRGRNCLGSGEISSAS